jgi:hypothetical protein
MIQFMVEIFLRTIDIAFFVVVWVPFALWLANCRQFILLYGLLRYDINRTIIYNVIFDHFNDVISFKSYKRRLLGLWIINSSENFLLTLSSHNYVIISMIYITILICWSDITRKLLSYNRIKNTLKC